MLKKMEEQELQNLWHKDGTSTSLYFSIMSFFSNQNRWRVVKCEWHYRNLSHLFLLRQCSTSIYHNYVRESTQPHWRPCLRQVDIDSCTLQFKQLYMCTQICLHCLVLPLYQIFSNICKNGKNMNMKLGIFDFIDIQPKIHSTIHIQ